MRKRKKVRDFRGWYLLGIEQEKFKAKRAKEQKERFSSVLDRSISKKRLLGQETDSKGESKKEVPAPNEIPK